MAIQVINIGTSPNKGDGEPLRTAFDKINDNWNNQRKKEIRFGSDISC